ncbi:hypothetical protein MTR67_018941 [Solanum verrucosum]|uniref:Tf2-1-like SH3-like domain-containing protein n=1 Tax=Solanum verrucosum TaxID=315347 RepID=A0AAF0QRQ1_SOLVR|nr:hypothetical protein MTR67_018941 [Solanum verrucosum]
MKVVMRFGKKWKLSSRYVGPYKILKRVSKVAYELELPAELATMHPIFHISLFKKCVGDPTSIVPLESVAAKDSLTYEDVSDSVVAGGTDRHHPQTVGDPRSVLLVYGSQPATLPRNSDNNYSKA